jgi:hypothetical protein
MHTITESALESIRIKQGHEELEVLFFAIMWGGCEQEEVPGQAL